MKVRLTKLLTLFLALSMFCTSFAGCVLFPGLNSGTGTSGTGNNTDPPEEAKCYTYVEGKYLVTSGKSEYIVIIPDDADWYIEFAASELVLFFSEATGASLKIRKESTADADVKYISLGDTERAAELEDPKDGIELEGYRIKSEGDNLYILGDGSHGVLWGVYGLLRLLFNYEFYLDDIYDIDTGIIDLNMIDIDHYEAPDIAYRAIASATSDAKASYGQDGKDTTTLRYQNRGADELKIDDGHNALTVLPPDKYLEDHPDWYASGGKMLCYSAHGNAEEYEMMVETVANYCYNRFLSYPDKNYVMFGIADTSDWCTCDTCLKSKAETGSTSTEYLRMSHDVWVKVDEKLKANGDTREVKIVPMIYWNSENLPGKYNESAGKWELTDPTLDLEGVCPWYCMLFTRRQTKPINDPENEFAANMLEQLNTFFSEFWVYAYGVSYAESFIPYDTFNTLKSDCELYASYENCTMFKYLLDFYGGDSTGFGKLKTYLASRLSWDSSLDVNELTENFFKAAYGEGADEMMEIYRQYRILAKYNVDDHGDFEAWDDGRQGRMNQAEYWSQGTLLNWLSLYEKAQSDISYLKETDPVKYELYEKNLRAESMAIRYLYATIYMTADWQENIEFKINLYYDFINLGFDHCNENYSGGDYFLSLIRLDKSYIQ